jgi:hypothetical protein
VTPAFSLGLCVFCEQVLQMVDEGKLEDGGPSAEKVCMVAVCYHNSAVDHIFMQQVRWVCRRC